MRHTRQLEQRIIRKGKRNNKRKRKRKREGKGKAWEQVRIDGVQTRLDSSKQAGRQAGRQAGNHSLTHSLTRSINQVERHKTQIEDV
jgi:hypothetical protein